MEIAWARQAAGSIRAWGNAKSVASGPGTDGFQKSAGGTGMQREDWTLVAISSAGGDALTPVQLQKSLFLLGKGLPDEVGDGFYSFSPYNYGPFCGEIYADAEKLASEGFVRIEREVGRTWAEYAPTSAGLKRAEHLRKLAPRASGYLKEIVEWTRGLTFEQLVSAIYAAYPDQKVNSIFREPAR
jgi:hypothetical protein